ncbi:hypothetical protein N0V94_008800 [Neodidymelliopsis sp. IMI 364377]|nr:hypothetical protein N0V94_008800 [Neodidymelliopsis sp. IMI 364377]
MADLVSPDETVVSTALDRLEKLGTDDYIIAFGPNGRQFFATPNGCSATQLPIEILGDISKDSTQKITCASYGSHPNSWFFAYELVDGTCACRVGSAIPATLRQFLEKISSSAHLRSDLVALNPHTPVSETFTFIKKQRDAQEAPFVIHFYKDITYTTEAAPTIQDTRLQHVEQKPEKPKFFRWAISKRDGRPHPDESWELKLKKGQKIKVFDDMGRNWFIAEGRRDVRGWVHGTWLEFCGSKVHQDPQSTYTLFQQDMRKLLVPGQLREFPALREYTGNCSDAACQPLKGCTQLGICCHDLQTLLEGSGCYSYAWLKEERNVWHPDKFARYCDPEHKERLKESAQEVFVLYGVLMDMCSQE